MRRRHNDEIFVQNSMAATVTAKRRILEDNLLKYVCSECGNIGEHNEKKLSLQLDHINGNCIDHRLSNLRFLCPNCHSQTDTYAGKAVKGKKTKREKKINCYQEKLKKDRELFENFRNDESIGYGKWGWKSRLSKKIKISAQKVVPWLKRVDPNFLENISA